MTAHRPADVVLYGDHPRLQAGDIALGPTYCFSGYHGWQGTDRFITYAESPLDEIVFNPLLPREDTPRQAEHDLIEAIGPRRALLVDDAVIGGVRDDGTRACILETDDGHAISVMAVYGPELELVANLYDDLRTFWAWSENLPEHLLLFERLDGAIIAAVKAAERQNKDARHRQ